jgi:hypothetical protein
MQTFLPYPNFSRSAKVLDVKRLGKQRVECLQILKVLRGETNKWQNHPAVRMWRGYEECLADYGTVICLEWMGRDYKDTCLNKIYDLRVTDEVIMPPWLGDERLHSSHRSNLLRKNYDWYSYFQWKESPDLPYYWPV